MATSPVRVNGSILSSVRGLYLGAPIATHLFHAAFVKVVKQWGMQASNLPMGHALQVTCPIDGSICDLSVALYADDLRRTSIPANLKSIPNML